LKGILSGLAQHLFGDVPMRWNDEYFPFTEPSFELEVFFQGKWMEVLGCGVIHADVMANSNRPQDFGWAFGLGLERLAMILFDIPDIRLFWTQDERFLSQFDETNPQNRFIPYSKFPPCYKDVSFWLPDRGLHPNDVYEVSDIILT
jgi:phenylalanyl-tRNA synthetase alpha chain